MPKFVIDDYKLMSEWDYEKNDALGIKPNNISIGNNRLINWICPKGHKFIASAHNRFKGSGCPYCSNKKALVGFNDFATLCPDLLSEWDYEKNVVKPTNIVCGSKTKVWWKCNLGHSWQQPIYARKKNNGCPYCNGKKILPGFNDFATLYPVILDEWDFEKNNVDPKSVGVGYKTKVFWKCKKGHSWEAIIYNRIRGNGCPICSNQKIVEGINDIGTTHPFLLKEWDYQKNIIKPQEVGHGSEKMVWWKCNTGHSWRARVYQRTQGHGCPVCNNELSSSFPEQAIFYYIQVTFPDALNRYKDKSKRISEIDIFIPSLNIGIEYNGLFYHTDTSRDEKKYKIVLEQGIRLIRVIERKEKEIKINKDDIYVKNHPNNKDLDIVIKKIFEMIGIESRKTINVMRDQFVILEKHKNNEVKNSIGSLFPNLINEWSDKNSPLSPFAINAGSDRKYWWICSKGHEYLATPSNRTLLNRGCPICSNKIVLRGFNDLATFSPGLIEEWDFEKNGKLTPYNVTSNSGRKVWWKCKNGHSWQAVISNRVKGIGCPICSNKKVLRGFNDLATLRPDLLKEWNFEKNTNLSPYNVTVGSGKRAWWICSKGHEWITQICTRQKSGCPVCYKLSKKKD